MFVLDTDVLSNLMKRVASHTLEERLASTPREHQFTTSITVGEIVYGAYRNPDRTAVLLSRLDGMILPNLTVLPFSEEAARVYGRVKAEMESRGQLIGEADLRIAAVALEQGHTVITGNVRHFQQVPGLSVENWLA